MSSPIDDTLSAGQLAGALAAGRIGSRDLLEHYLARIAQRNAPVNAVIALDVGQARLRADEADAATRRGERWGPLHGLPMTIKDTWEVPGMPCTAGAPQYRDHRPQRPAAVVQRLQQAGAIIFGKTNVPYKALDIQTDNPVHGLTRNPWAPELTTGGSSGGAAAALACGFTPLEVGSDIGGSIRIPAHFCGIYGHKSSHGIVSMRGHVPGDPGHIGEPDLAVAGPMARSADDLALALEVIAGAPSAMQPGWRLDLPMPRRERLADFRVLMWTDDADCPIEARMTAAYRDLAAQLARAGAQVSHGSPAGMGLMDLYPSYTLQMGAVMKAWLTRGERMAKGMVAPAMGWTPALLRGLDKVVDLPKSIDKFIEGMTMSHGRWLDLIEGSHALRERFNAVFNDHEVTDNKVSKRPQRQQASIYTSWSRRKVSKFPGIRATVGGSRQNIVSKPAVTVDDFQSSARRHRQVIYRGFFRTWHAATAGRIKFSTAPIEAGRHFGHGSEAFTWGLLHDVRRCPPIRGMGMTVLIAASLEADKHCEHRTASIKVLQ